MPDVFTKTKRSDVRSRIRSRGNRDPELALLPANALDVPAASSQTVPQ